MSAKDLDDKAAQAKAILTKAVEDSKIPERDKDPRVQQAFQILNNAANRGKAGYQEVSTTHYAPGTHYDDNEVYKALSPGHKQCLRHCYQDPVTYEWSSYYLGTLKSFSSKNGYGFISAPSVSKEYGTDVFVHKNQVPVPWNLGQPVEFAMYINPRGQPQATDCFWLPKMFQQRPPTQAYPKQVPGGPAGGLGALARGPHEVPRPQVAVVPSQSSSSPAVITSVPASPAVASNADAGPTQGPTVRNFDSPYFIGTLKSYSAAQGYGFIDCEETFKAYNRDIYFDRHQLPRPEVYNQGQTLEFQVSSNARGQPQARNLLWDAVPTMPLEANTEPSIEAKQKKHTSQQLEKLRRLNRFLNDGDKESAVVTAIDFQGVESPPAAQEAGANGTNVTPDADYVTFVLDRLGTEDRAFAGIKDFVKMLLLLMLAKMINKSFSTRRLTKFISWTVSLASAISPSNEKQVQQHFAAVVGQIEGNFSTALEDNEHVKEPPLSDMVSQVLQMLKDKCKATASAEPASAGQSKQEAKPAEEPAEPAKEAKEESKTEEAKA